MFALVVILVMLGVGAVFVLTQRGYINSYFEFGQQSEITGYLVSEPVWALRTSKGDDVKTIPLVGFGKFGADKTIDRIIDENGLEPGDEITIRGTRFYYRDKYWMELTDGEESFVGSGEGKFINGKPESIGMRKLEGEVVDPKCFFGVMNPAAKAVHRSCAIRCISGGIPPVLAIRENGEFVDYYFIKGEDINQSILAYVGIPVELEGEVSIYEDWKVVDLGMADIRITATEGFCSGG